jgi:monoamine oxidase
MEKVIIIGGGISGLVAAHSLKKKGLNALLLESSHRLGGRIYTKSINNNDFELGATWVFQDPVLRELIKELNLVLYPQYLKGDALIKYAPSIPIEKSPTDSLMNGAVYHKVEGGTGAIIDALAKQLDSDQIGLNSRVRALSYEDESVTVTLADGSILMADKVILAMPPKTIADQITITPQLENQDIMASTHTWMGESSKFTVILDKDYWRTNNLSGFVYSNYGLIREIQDHNSTDGKSFRLVGFMRPEGVLIVDFERRKQVIIQELKELFGIDESHVLGYDDFLWGQHYLDQANQNYNVDMMPHEHNGHPFYRTAHFDNHLFFAGAETSSTNPGYMEGAVKSGYRVVNAHLREDYLMSY